MPVSCSRPSANPGLLALEGPGGSGGGASSCEGGGGEGGGGGVQLLQRQLDALRELPGSLLRELLPEGQGLRCGGC